MLVTLDEAKERLSIDFDTKDDEITSRVKSIEGYLSFGTGLTLDDIADEDIKNVAKEYVLLKLYLDYYSLHTELDDARLTQMMKQLQAVALIC